MDDPRWLRLIVIGLILAALLVGYMLLSGNFIKSKPTSKNNEVSNQTTTRSPNPAITSATASAVPSTSPQASSSARSAYDKISGRSQNGVQTLPRTGIPSGFIVSISILAVIYGWSLRKYSD